MDIQYVDPNDIKPDPKQPRHFFDIARIKEMAKSILTEGVINPIEVDKYFVIITGEMRWRSAKEAGLTEIPVKIIEINDEDRFERQYIENIHHNTMTSGDTSRATDILCRKAHKKFGGAEDIIGHSYGEKTIEYVANRVGKGIDYIYEKLRYFKQSDKVQKYLDSSKGKSSLIREIDKYAPDEFKEDLKEKVADGELNNYRVATELSKALTRQPEKSDELLNRDWKNAKDRDVSIIHDIVPEEKFLANEELGVEISRKITQLIILLKKVDKKNVYAWEKQEIKRDTVELMELLKEFNTDILVLEGEIV